MITFVINSLGRGGAERSILTLARELVRRGEPLRIVCLYEERSEYDPGPELAGRVDRLGARSFPTAVRRLLSHLRRQRPTLVFSLMPQSNLAAVTVARLLSLPIVTSERTTPVGFYPSFARLYLALLPHLVSDSAVFISQYALRCGLPDNALGRRIRGKARVLLNPVDAPLPILTAAQARARRLDRLRAAVAPRGEGASATLAIVGRLEARKGHLEFLDQAADLLRRANLRLRIVGEGPMRERIEARIAALGLASQVSCDGFSDDMADVYGAADVVVLASRSEGFGRVGFEAYLAGCLVIGTPENSFVDEVVPAAPAWAQVGDFRDLERGLGDLLSRSIPANGQDIKAMEAALSTSTHAERFLRLIEGTQGERC